MDSLDDLSGRMEDPDEGEQGCWSWILGPVFTFVAGFAIGMAIMALVS
jgi:hypothetical protein